MGFTSIIGTYHLSNRFERESGMVWYDTAQTRASEFSAQFPVGIIKAAGVIAALSPNNPWERNVRDAHAMIQTFHALGAWEAEKVKVCTFNANKLKALTILKLQGPNVEDVINVLKGRKVCSFFKCILGDRNEVCVDGQCLAIMIILRLAFLFCSPVVQPIYSSSGPTRLH
jgi:hypothetical protein